MKSKPAVDGLTKARKHYEFGVTVLAVLGLIGLGLFAWALVEARHEQVSGRLSVIVNIFYTATTALLFGGAVWGILHQSVVMAEQNSERTRADELRAAKDRWRHRTVAAVLLHEGIIGLDLGRHSCIDRLNALEPSKVSADEFNSALNECSAWLIPSAALSDAALLREVGIPITIRISQILGFAAFWSETVAGGQRQIATMNANGLAITRTIVVGHLLEAAQKNLGVGAGIWAEAVADVSGQLRSAFNEPEPPRP